MGKSQWHTQLPPLQDWLVPHFFPHWPQLLESLKTSTHWLLHSATFGGQVTSHAPLTQVEVPPEAAEQTLPQTPQFALSAFRSTQAVPQGERPCAQAMVQFPPAHAGLPLPAVGGGHALQPAPQCCGSTVVSKQVVPAPQVENPGEQPTPQAPPAQVGKPFGVPGQTVVQVPQWLGSVVVPVSQPFAGLPSQSA